MSDPISIGFVSSLHGHAWGGSEELWADAALRAFQRGHKVYFSTHSATAPVSPKIEQMEAKGGVHFYHRPEAATFIGRNIDRLRRVALGSRQFFPVERNSPFRDFFSAGPAVVCITFGDAYGVRFLPDLVEFLNRSNVPYVVNCQGTRNHVDLSDEGRATIRDFFQKAYRVVFVADENLRGAERQIAADIENSIVLRNPVNISSAEVLPWSESETASFATVARLDVVTKAQDVLLQALSGDEWRQRNWQLTVYGSGPHGQYLGELTRHYQLQDKVIFAGQAADIRSVWEKNQLLTLPSRDEGTPLVLIEAMLCGRPALVTEVGGMPEWITDGETGFIAEAASVPSVDRALERAWQRRDRWQEMGRNAHRFALQNYDPDPGGTLLDLLEGAAVNEE